MKVKQVPGFKAKVDLSYEKQKHISHFFMNREGTAWIEQDARTGGAKKRGGHL